MSYFSSPTSIAATVQDRSCTRSSNDLLNIFVDLENYFLFRQTVILAKCKIISLSIKAAGTELEKLLGKCGPTTKKKKDFCR